MGYQHILVSVDDSPISLAAADQAMMLAKAMGSKVTIVSIVVIDPLTSVSFYKNVPGVTDYFMEAKAHAKNILAELAVRFSEAGITAETKLLAKQSPSEWTATTLLDKFRLFFLHRREHYEWTTIHPRI